LYQKQTEIEHHKSKLKKHDADAHQLEKQYNEKLVELQNQINILQHQLTSTKDENDRCKKDLQETQEKYTEKARYVRWNSEVQSTLIRY